MTFRRRPDPLHRDRPAGQAGRRRRHRPHGRHDGARHRLPAASPREGIDFLPLTVDYREYTYASGRIPGGFFKREGKPTEKEVLTSRADRPADPAAVPGGLAQRDADHRARALGRHRERLGRARDHRRVGGAGAVGASRSRRRSPACASAWSTAQYVINPTFEQRKQSTLDLIVAGSKRRHRDGRGGRQGSVRRGDGPGPRAAHAAIKEIVGGIDALAAGRPARPRSWPRAEGRSTTTFYREVEDKVLGPLTEAMRIKGKLENYAHGRPGARTSLIADAARGRRRAEGRSQGRSSRSLQEKVLRDEILERGQPPRRPQVRRDPPDHDRGRRAARARTARRCSPAARPRRWSRPRSAPPTTSRRSRRSTARRGSASCSTTTSRRSRSAKSSSMRGPGRREIGHGALAERVARADDAGRGRRSPTPSASSRTSSSRTARSSMASVCGGSLAMMDAGVPLKAPVAGVAMGLDHGREDRQVRGPDRHRRRRGPLRRHGLQGRRHRRRASPRCRWTSRSRASRPTIMRKALEQARQGRHAHPRQDGRRRWRSRAPSISTLRAAHRHDQDPGRQDPRRHRPRRQDDPQHHRADRREDRRRGRRPRERGVGRRGRRRRRRSASSRS